jgi:hypothetical protein
MSESMYAISSNLSSIMREEVAMSPTSPTSGSPMSIVASEGTGLFSTISTDFDKDCSPK